MNRQTAPVRRPRRGQKLYLVSMVRLAAAVFAIALQVSSAQRPQTVWTDQEKPIIDQLGRLRQLPDDMRARTTGQLAIQIRQLPPGANKLSLAGALANLSTEGDCGSETLQEVATTLANALRERPAPADKGQPAAPYVELAQLVRYEHMKAAVDDPQFAAAMAKLDADEQLRRNADFTLADLSGREWNLKSLRGKVVLVNLWATWCPPCRKEMPDLEVLYRRFRHRGLVILAISGEDGGKVKPFIAERKFTYPILLDPGGKVNELFRVDGIPKSFVYDREGKLVAQAIDMRTQAQFLAMLAQAGLQ
jgi:peroxiredoxin